MSSLPPYLLLSPLQREVHPGDGMIIAKDCVLGEI